MTNRKPSAAVINSFHLIHKVALRVGSYVDRVVIMKFHFDVADVSMKLAPWRSTASIAKHHLVFWSQTESETTKTESHKRKCN